MAYGVIRTDNMSGTTLGKDLISVRFQASGTDAAIENGAVVLVGDYLDGEVRKASAPKKGSALSTLAIVANEEIVKSKSANTMDEFINEAGSNARAYRLRSGDTFSLKAAALEGTPALNNVVELQEDSTKLAVKSVATASTTTVGKIVLVEGDWFVIEVA